MLTRAVMDWAVISGFFANKIKPIQRWSWGERCSLVLWWIEQLLAAYSYSAYSSLRTFHSPGPRPELKIKKKSTTSKFRVVNLVIYFAIQYRWFYTMQRKTVRVWSSLWIKVDVCRTELIWMADTNCSHVVRIFWLSSTPQARFRNRILSQRMATDSSVGSATGCGECANKQAHACYFGTASIA